MPLLAPIGSVPLTCHRGYTALAQRARSTVLGDGGAPTWQRPVLLGFPPPTRVGELSLRRREAAGSSSHPSLS